MEKYEKPTAIEVNIELDDVVLLSSIGGGVTPNASGNWNDIMGK